MQIRESLLKSRQGHSCLGALVVCSLLAFSAAAGFGVDRAVAAGFVPTMDVDVSPYSSDSGTANGAPEIQLMLKRPADDGLLQNAEITLPLHWRINQNAPVTYCSTEALGESVLDAMPEIPDDLPKPEAHRTLVGDFTEDCPDGAEVGSAKATLFCNEGSENEICKYLDETNHDEFPVLRGDVQLRNPTEYFGDNEEARKIYGISEEDLAGSAEALPVVFSTVLKTTDEYGELINLAMIHSEVYARPGDYRIEIAIRDMLLAQYGLVGLDLNLYGGPSYEMPLETTGPSLGLTRTPAQPNCNGPQQFDIKFESYAKSTGGVQQSVTNQPSVDLTGCDSAPFPFAPTVAFEPTTTQALASPTAKIIIKRKNSDSAISNIDLKLPQYLYGSPLTAPLCTPNMAATTVADVCPASSHIGTVKMKAIVWANKDPITLVGEAFVTQPSPFNLVGVVIAGKLPAIGRNAVVVLKSDMGLYGETIDGVVGHVRDLPVEVSFTDIEITFEGATGASEGHPLLLLPPDCGAKELQADFSSESGQAHTATTPFQATGCDNLTYDPSTSVKTSTTEPGGLPELRIKTGQAFGQATTKTVFLRIPQGFGINNKTTLVPCKDSDVESKSCPPNSKMGEAKITTPLMDPLTADVFLADAPPGNKKIIKRVVTRVQVPDGSVAQLVSNLERNTDGTLGLILDGLPGISITDLNLVTYGGSSGLMTLPSACGDFVFETLLTSHSGKTAKRNATVQVEGQECRPRLSASLTPNRAGSSAKLRLASLPNAGVKYNEIVKAEFELGKGRNRLKATLKGPKRRSKAKGVSAASRSSAPAGVLRVTPKSGRPSAIKLMAHGKTAKAKPGKGQSIKAFNNVKLQLKRGRLIVSGLPKIAIKELTLELGKQKGLKLRAPKRRGTVTIKGKYLLGNGKSVSAEAKVKVGPKRKKKKKRKS